VDKIAAVILAGGEARRLGGAVKANIEIGGMRLLERVAGVLADAETILVAHGRLDPALLALPAGMVPIADPAGALRGPAAGLAAAAAWVAARRETPELIVSAAVDTPFLPANFLARLRGAMSADIEAAIAGYGDEIYWTNALWRRTALARLLAPGIGRTASAGGIKAFARGVRMIVVRWPETAAGDPFANVNTPLDLAELARRNT
jgi:molybdopterin-guanine dinucleotide biosynthesis protein A